MCGVPRTCSTEATDTDSRDNNSKYFSSLTITQTALKQCQHFEEEEKKFPPSLAVGWLLWVCACMPGDLF